MIAEDVKNNKWFIKVGLNSNGMTDMRQTVYESFNTKLSNLGMNVELIQTGLMSADSAVVLVEVSLPNGGSVYYGLSTPDDVEHVINGHIVGGKAVSELVIPADGMNNIKVRQKGVRQKEVKQKEVRQKGAAYSSSGKIKIDVHQWREAFNLLGLGWFLGLSILAGVLGGLWLDNKLETKPLYILLGLFLGIIVAALGAYQMLSPLFRNKD